MTTSTPKPRRWLQPRFSLAGLLLFTTAFAVAVWVWTWPYEEVIQSPGSDAKVITTWKRNLIGGRAPHGPRRRINESFESTSHYHDGVLHGPYLQQVERGSETKGQYVRGKREGVWTSANASGVEQTSMWIDGQLDGPLEVRSPDGTVKRYRFSRDRLLDDEGHPVDFWVRGQVPAIDLPERLLRAPKKRRWLTS